MIGGVAAHLGRLGGMITSPRQTLEVVVEGREGSIWEILPWVLLVGAALSPTGTGQAFLLTRVSLLSGASLFFNTVSNRMAPGLTGVLIGAVILAIVGHRSDGKKVGFEAALDAVSFLLVPFFLMASIGAILSWFGFEFWFMPHRKLQGRGWVLAVRAIVAYGWPLALYLLLFRGVTRRTNAAAVTTEGSPSESA